MLTKQKENLKAIFDDLQRTGIAESQAQIAFDLGYSPQYLTDLVSKKETPITDKFLKKLSQAYPINFEYLNNKKGEPLIYSDFPKYKNLLYLRRETAGNNPVNNIHSITANNTIDLPLLEVAARSIFASHYKNHFTGLKTFRTLNTVTKIESTSLVIEISENDYMGNQLKPYDKVLAEELNREKWNYINGVVAIAIKDQFLTVKRIKENELSKGFLTLYADEEKGGNFIVSENQIENLYKITTIVESKVV